MTPKEFLKKIKDEFKAQFDPSIPPVAPASTTDPAPVISCYPVDGGQPIYVDNSDDGVSDIDQDDKVYVDPAMSAPYPDGEYKVTGTDFGFMVSGGAVTQVTDASGAGPGAPVDPNAMGAPAPKTADVPPAPTMEERMAALEAMVAELVAAQKTYAAAPPATATLSADDAKALKMSSDKILAYDKVLNNIFELMEKLTELPTADPKTLTGGIRDAFERTEKREEKFRKIAEAVKVNAKEKMY